MTIIVRILGEKFPLYKLLQAYVQLAIIVQSHNKGQNMNDPAAHMALTRAHV